MYGNFCPKVVLAKQFHRGLFNAGTFCGERQDSHVVFPANPKGCDPQSTPPAVMQKKKLMANFLKCTGRLSPRASKKRNDEFCVVCCPQNK